MTTVNNTSGTFSNDFLSGVNGTSNVNNVVAGSASDLQNQFLTMLVAQMNNQDPLNPLDNSQVTSQLAQISTVSGIAQLNSTLQSVTNQITATQSMQAAGMIGHGVLVPGNRVAVGDGVATPFGFTLGQAADTVTVSIVNASGQTVRTVTDGPVAAGVQTLGWDGRTDTGALAPDGAYTVVVTAKANGQSITATPLSYGIVNSVMQDPANGVLLDLGPAGTAKLGDVAQIFTSPSGDASDGTAGGTSASASANASQTAAN